VRILSLTAGAAGMYCGSCLRDNSLATALIARGHDVTLQPVYTPTLVDEPNVSASKVLMGGISIYLQQHVPWFRRTPRLLDRLWDSPRVIRAFASGGGSTDARLLGEMTISTLEGPRGVLKKEFDKLVDWIRSEPLPDVINLPNSLLIAMAQPLREAVGRPVFCTLQGEELFLNGLTGAYRDRAIALIKSHVPSVDRFIAVSNYCAAFMSEFLEIPPARIDVVPLGITMDGYGRHAGADDHFTVGYFARIAPEKGLHVLADAYIRLRRRLGGAQIRLEAAGYMASSQAGYLDDVRRMLDSAGLGGEFTYRGVVDRAGKLVFLQGLDVLSVPATYDEPKGMFLLEAMACGVPVVQPERGAFPEVIDRTGGGLLVKPDDPADLADGLYALWSDRALARELGRRAFDGVRAHYDIGRSADRLIEVYSKLRHGHDGQAAADTPRPSVA
jgi:glycosyltransferase involved in cell wall biosynthesis